MDRFIYGVRYSLGKIISQVEYYIKKKENEGSHHACNNRIQNDPIFKHDAPTLNQSFLF
jgi:hypothetical protein